MTTEQLLKINGGQKLVGGKVSIAGSSNQVTKCIIAALLTNEHILIKNAPAVNERKIAEELFAHLGGEVEYVDEHAVRLCAYGVTKNSISREICQKNRISILAVGPLLHRFGSAYIYGTLGGDKIGKRPVDFHIKGLQEMGAQVELDGDLYHLTVDENGLQGAHIALPFPSVMTTENLIIAATLAKGRTIIENAAIEPEIIELVKMLQKMGADITINANRTYVIQGVSRLKGCELRIMPDRNQAVSFACAALATGGNVLLEKIPHDPLYSFLNYIQRMGAEFRVNSEGIFVASPKGKRLKQSHIEVEVHPGFMTDWQQPFMVLFTQADGISILHETIFEDRLSYTRYLNSMGANINLFSTCLGEAPCRFKNKNHVHSAIIHGPTPLTGGNFRMPTDIRAGMCLVIAGLVASGTTLLSNIQELQRKYDNIVQKLNQMGADVSIVNGQLTK
ncbi:UDP-N-acetylglucosamine 1-carboxyvinyltransferase [Pigmentibacter sp. JX0631]|uniref:UDP-N-acetylglucosamine 1-carboxyvinyltransferase n=1 Tax=Pigmentibacter sp. JX0631 TaxID=2976982 RepID=UPI0024685FC3|nr:UDP-N-acetylglucosamine 1-carboxyvinyltransferase [Pigmentibacter sp. JX0631]WGL58701.1 UDP-N-acetylglucosamine 1-carboxyvinyltransferase [Pigmentibacter sp. JX0631]